MTDKPDTATAAAPTKSGWRKVLDDHAGFQKLLQDTGADLQYHGEGFEAAPRTLQPQQAARIYIAARELLVAHGYDLRGSHTPVLSTIIKPQA
jgi:hypothetical protein